MGHCGWLIFPNRHDKHKYIVDQPLKCIAIALLNQISQSHRYFGAPMCKIYQQIADITFERTQRPANGIYCGLTKRGYNKIVSHRRTMPFSSMCIMHKHIGSTENCYKSPKPSEKGNALDGIDSMVAILYICRHRPNTHACSRMHQRVDTNFHLFYYYFFFSF